MLCLINPVSGNGAGREVLERLRRVQQTRINLDLVELDRGGWPRQIQQLDHYKSVVLAGGDGTLASLLPQLVGKTVKVGLMPLGTANDLAKECGIYRLFSADQPQTLLDAFLFMKTKPLMVWRLSWGKNSALFSNYASFGFEGQVVAAFDARRNTQKKRRAAGVLLNRLNYLLAGFQSLRSGLVRCGSVAAEQRTVFSIGGSPVRSLIFSNIRSMMGLAISNPHSNPFDSQIEGMVVSSLADYAVMFLRHHVPMPSGKFLGSASTWRILNLDPEVMLQLDGEAKGALGVTEVSIEAAGVINLLVA
ncbi:MAG: hypothetical protein GX589_10030 [Deltaproteobacteria bacterium]|nr:hypothetical protein [Deltaproteobacteria bacterium]